MNSLETRGLSHIGKQKVSQAEHMRLKTPAHAGAPHEPQHCDPTLARNQDAVTRVRPP
jgi:hypothetical protein